MPTSFNNNNKKTDKKNCTDIKKLLGNDDKSRATCIRDHNEQKLDENSDKETIFRNYWKNIFNISEEENFDFDRHTDKFI